WGPKHLYGYVNNFNLPILVTACNNHDIKLITNVFSTSNMTWYITTYATKKQTKSLNASALLAKMVTFHKHSTDAINSFWMVNKWLLQRCVNTLGCLQEFSAQEVIRYIMGWGDRYLSYYYIPIYMKGLKVTLLNVFPQLW
ncbi:hypothetical protein ARMSODRAFT_883562, partial [Armillaria solidipes]